jgi:hypothetical protein
MGRRLRTRLMMRVCRSFGFSDESLSDGRRPMLPSRTEDGPSRLKNSAS